MALVCLRGTATTDLAQWISARCQDSVSISSVKCKLGALLFFHGNIFSWRQQPLHLGRRAMQHKTGGFSLIEILIALVIVSILTAVAVPAYGSYVLRARLTEAYVGLAAFQPSAEQYWSNNRTYQDVGAASLGQRLPPASSNFTYAVSGASASAYTVTATGTGPAAGFAFTLDQSGNRATTAAPTGWTLNNACWIDRKEGKCTQ
jgi:type IV pilus assembly protein PilE